MSSKPHESIGTSFSQSRYLRRLVLVYVVFWALAAIAPVDRQTWLLENLLVIGVALLLALSHRAFVFSPLSYTMILAFLALHVVGSHYTYSAVPAGACVAEQLELGRNHYDRLVHFCFGLLLAYPLRELALRAMHVHRVWSYVVPVVAILALSSVYEMIEAWAAHTVAPGVGVAFVGAQGDVWDGQKDMGLALAGGIAAMLLVALHRGITRREPYASLR